MLTIKLCTLILLSNYVYSRIATEGTNTDNYVANTKNRSFVTLKPQSYFDSLFSRTTKDSIKFDYQKTTRVKSTTTVEPTTTEKFSTTTGKPDPLQKCSTSLHSKNDLEILIEHLVNKTDVFNNITRYSHESAAQITEIVMQEIRHFYVWLENRPEHLEDILKGFNDTRNTLEPLIQKISFSIEKFKNVLEKYKGQNNTAEVLFRKFRKSDKICDINCGKSIIIGKRRNNILRRSQDYDPKVYYCGSIVEIYDVIISNLTKYSELLQNDINSKISNDTEFYNHQIEVMKSNLKAMVLKTFDRTMYEVLNLQDKYHHLSENITKVDIDSSINKINHNTADLYAKLMTFEDAVEKFGTFCRTCESNLFSRSAIPNSLKDDIEYDDLLSELIRAKEDEIGTKIISNYQSILKSLNNEVKQPYNIEFIERIDQLQKSIAEDTEKEKVKYADLKNRIDQLPLTELNNVQKESTELLDTIEKYIDLINNFIVKN